MPIKCQLVKAVSKSGNEYYRLEIQLTPNYRKLVFLDRAEQEILLAQNNKQS